MIEHVEPEGPKSGMQDQRDWRVVLSPSCRTGQRKEYAHRCVIHLSKLNDVLLCTSCKLRREIQYFLAFAQSQENRHIQMPCVYLQDHAHHEFDGQTVSTSNRIEYRTCCNRIVPATGLR